MSVKEFFKRADAASRLDLFLRENLPDFFEQNGMDCELSNSKIRRLIVAGAITVNTHQVRQPSFLLKADDRISAVIDEDKFFFEKKPDDIHFEVSDKDILFEDEYLILVNKPAYFPTEATIAGDRDNLHASIIRYLWKKNPSLRNPPYAGIMHRLDRETSGVILFTKQRTVNAEVHKMFDSSSPEHSARKTYLAVCDLASAHCGTKLKLHNDLEFSVEMYMGRISPKSQAAKWGFLSKEKGGVFSHTDFKVLQIRNRKMSDAAKNKGAVGEVRQVACGAGAEGTVLIRACPVTGRTHQIRVHLASQGLPIAGDELYGARNSESRIMLHAQSLSFIHPVTKQELVIEAPLPPGF